MGWGSHGEEHLSCGGWAPRCPTGFSRSQGEETPQAPAGHQACRDALERPQTVESDLGSHPRWTTSLHWSLWRSVTSWQHLPTPWGPQLSGKSHLSTYSFLLVPISSHQLLPTPPPLPCPRLPSFVHTAVLILTLPPVIHSLSCSQASWTRPVCPCPSPVLRIRSRSPPGLPRPLHFSGPPRSSLSPRPSLTH